MIVVAAVEVMALRRDVTRGKALRENGKFLLVIGRVGRIQYLVPSGQSAARSRGIVFFLVLLVIALGAIISSDNG